MSRNPGPFTPVAHRDSDQSSTSPCSKRLLHSILHHFLEYESGLKLGAGKFQGLGSGPSLSVLSQVVCWHRNTSPSNKRKPSIPQSALPSSGLRFSSALNGNALGRIIPSPVMYGVQSGMLKLEQNLKISQAKLLIILMRNMAMLKRVAHHYPVSKPGWNPGLLIPGPGLFLLFLLIRSCSKNVFLEEQKRERKGGITQVEKGIRKKKKKKETWLDFIIFQLQFSSFFDSKNISWGSSMFQALC